MRIALGSDHAGFALKRQLAAHLLEREACTVIDVGAYDEAPSDYPDYAEAVGRAVLEGRAERGILICGSGVGASVGRNETSLHSTLPFGAHNRCNSTRACVAPGGAL